MSSKTRRSRTNAEGSMRRKKVPGDEPIREEKEAADLAEHGDDAFELVTPIESSTSDLYIEI
jgi:hypothetical protein